MCGLQAFILANWGLSTGQVTSFFNIGCSYFILDTILKIVNKIAFEVRRGLEDDSLLFGANVLCSEANYLRFTECRSEHHTCYRSLTLGGNQVDIADEIP